MIPAIGREKKCVVHVPNGVRRTSCAHVMDVNKAFILVSQVCGKRCRIVFEPGNNGIVDLDSWGM